MVSTRMTQNDLQERCHSSVLVKKLDLGMGCLQGFRRVGLCLPLLVFDSPTLFPRKTRIAS